MPARKANAKRLTDEDEPQNERNRPGKEMRIERQAIAAEEIRLTVAEKIDRKVRREVIAITGDNAQSDLQHEQSRQPGEETLWRDRASGLHRRRTRLRRKRATRCILASRDRELL